MRPQRYAELASLMFAGEATFAIVHRVTERVYSGYVPAFSFAIDDADAVLWVAAATAAMLHRPRPWAFVLVALAAVASLVYGVTFSIASKRGLGVPFMVAAVALAAALIAAALRRSLPAWRIDAASLMHQRVREVWTAGPGVSGTAHR
jgi:hypothetical protein